MSVKAVRIIRDTATNIGKGFGYVLFSDKNAAQMALAKASLTLRNRPLRVTRVVRSKTKAAVQKQSAYTGALGAAGTGPISHALQASAFLLMTETATS